MRTEVDDALLTLANRQDDVFSRTEAEDAGADARLRFRRVKSGRWVAVGAAGFRFGAASLTWRGLLRCALWDAGGRALVSHAAAAQLHRFPGFSGNEVHVVVPRALDHVCTIATVHESRRFDQIHRREVRGIPVVAPSDALVQVAPSLRYARLSWLTDELLLSGRLQLTAIEEALQRIGTGCRGMKPLRAIVGDHQPGEAIPESELEKLFLRVATTFGLPKFTRQASLPGRDQFPNRVDFLWGDVRLIVELDGRRWHARFRDFDRDHRRDLHWLALGYRTARITWAMLLTDPARVCADLLAARAAAA